MITKSIKRTSSIFCGLCLLCALCVSCADFFEQDSEHVIFTEEDHLNNATDTIYSVTGILTKLQAIADRTILLGEVRGDLVDVTSTANSDLRDLAFFNVHLNVTGDRSALIIERKHRQRHEHLVRVQARVLAMQITDFRFLYRFDDVLRNEP